MYRRSLTLLTLFSTAAFADFSYQQTSRITGGAMAGMMKVAGAFSAKAREPIVSSVLIKGDRMAHVNRDKITVIDLAKETFTDIDLQKKTWSVMTFTEMAEAMKRAAEKMKQEKKNEAELSFKASVKETGQTKPISGYDTRQVLVTLTMEGRDTKSGQTGAMDMQMYMWVAPSVAGYEEVQSFYRRMADKLAWSPLASVAGALAQQNNKGLAELTREMAKLQGIPVLQITRMGAGGMPEGSAPSEADQQQAAAAEQQRAQTADENRRNAAAEAIGGRLGRLGGGIGGLGGFGRKKKTEEPAQPAPQPQQQAPPARGGSSAPGVLMEITTESNGFSSAAVDTSKFEVPSGFRQVENDLKKMR